MNIGLYFGSFNPIHTGHLIIANHFINNTDIQQVWLIVSPQNPLKLSGSLLNEYHRLHLVQTAIEGENNLKASKVEFNLPKPSYTIDTLMYLEERYPEHTFIIIMGTDSIQNINKWKNYELLLRKYQIYIYPRSEYEANKIQYYNTIIVDAPKIEISSTMIRKLIKERKSIRYLVPDSVKEEIEINNYYKKELK
jgi:nicotinate-nucleotide adenylyltransferase